MSVRDHSKRRRPPRVRWLLTFLTAFTLGVVCAATLFAYSARIPIPLKISPTRTADDILRSTQTESFENKIEFQQRLESRVLVAPEAPANAATVAAPKLPEPAGGVEPAKVEATPAALAYFVQAGSFAEKDAAATLAAELDGQGLPAGVREGTSASGRLFRVVVGPYEEAKDAESVRAQLALLGRSSTMLRLAAPAGGN